MKRELVEMLGIQGLITSYSYQKGDRLFLEEDADASLLMRSLGELNIRYSVVDRHTNTDHWIRALDRYNALD